MKDLPQAMLADLKKSGLGPKDAAALGLEYSDSDERPCYAIPYFALDRQPTGHYRVRFLGTADQLLKDERGRPIRYTQPKGYPPRFYFAHIGGVKWKAIADDTGALLYFTEGEKKAAALSKLGVPAIGLGGVWNWFEDRNPLDDFNLFKWSGRQVKIVFDSDCQYKANVQKALKRLADELIKRGAVPSEVPLPALPGAEKTGVDDFLVHHGSGAKALKAFRALPEKPLLLPQGFTAIEIASMKLPEPKWVVQGLIPVGLSVLAGKPKIGKSWLTLDLSIAVSSGSKVLGGYDVRQAPVLHLALEDTKYRLQSRLKRVLDSKPAPDNCHFFLEWRRVEDYGLEAMRRWLDQHKDTRLVVIDTFAKMRVRPSSNGSLYHEDYDAIGQLKRIADDYDLGMVVVHHLRKAASNDPLDGVSGSTGLTGAGDTTLVLQREERLQADAVLFITGRDVESQEVALSMEPRTMQWRALGNAEDYRMGQERKQILDAFAALGKAAAPHEIAEFIGKKRGAVKKLMLTMAHKGKLEQLPGGLYEPRKKEAGSE